MTEREFVATVVDCHVVESSATHFGAERTRTFFLSFVKYDASDVGLFDYERDAYAITKVLGGLYLILVDVLEAHIYIDCYQVKLFGCELFVRCEHGKQSDTVFSTRKPDGDFVAVLDHFVVANCFSCKAQKFLHKQII